jgi:hypothetical protein
MVIRSSVYGSALSCVAGRAIAFHDGAQCTPHLCLPPLLYHACHHSPHPPAALSEQSNRCNMSLCHVSVPCVQVTISFALTCASLLSSLSCHH